MTKNEILLLSEPILMRFGTWINAYVINANYCEVMAEIRSVLQTFGNDNEASNKIPKSILKILQFSSTY